MRAKAPTLALPFHLEWSRGRTEIDDERAGNNRFQWMQPTTGTSALMHH